MGGHEFQGFAPLIMGPNPGKEKKNVGTVRDLPVK